MPRLTERPDVVAAHLTEGHIVILTDTSPTALIVPANVWHFTQHAEEYFQSPVVGTFMRWARFFAIALSLVLGPLWLMVAMMPNSPEWLSWVGPTEAPVVPLWLQFLLLEFGIVLIGQALIHTPSAMSTRSASSARFARRSRDSSADLRARSGVVRRGRRTHVICDAESRICPRLTAFPVFAVRAGGHFELLGICRRSRFTLLWLGLTNSFGLPYLYPLIPFDGKALVRLLFRFPIPQLGIRSAPKRPRKGAYPDS